eukprot:8567837-Ditylum_brightwellii.AAC.1
MEAIRLWQNTICTAISAGTLTPNSTKEAIYQQEQPNGCYFHHKDHHSFVECNTLNLLFHNAGHPRPGAASPLQPDNGGQGGAIMEDK